MSLFAICGISGAALFISGIYRPGRLIQTRISLGIGHKRLASLRMAARKRLSPPSVRPGTLPPPTSIALVRGNPAARGRPTKKGRRAPKIDHSQSGMLPGVGAPRPGRDLEQTQPDISAVALRTLNTPLARATGLSPTFK